MPSSIINQPTGIDKEETEQTETKPPFVYFPATTYTSNVCIKCLDRPLMKDDEAECCSYRGEPFCAHCSCLWFPFATIYDVVSFPIRGIKHCVSK